MACYDFDVFLEREELLALRTRYHFQADALPRLQILYQAVLPLVKGKMYLVIEGRKLFAAVSLGGVFDAFQNLYSGAGEIGDVYILECLGNALLEKSYGILKEKVYELCGRYVSCMSFPGDKDDFDEIGIILEKTAAEEISCNAAFAMSPSKSTAFTAYLDSEKRRGHIQGEGCRSCSRKNCGFRKL